MNKIKLASLVVILISNIVFSQNDIELIKSFSTGSTVDYIVNFNNKLYFAANDGQNGKELWTSDGSIVGTVLFKDIVAGAASSNPEQLTVLGNKLYFIALESANRKALYVSDGTSSGTIKLTSLSANSSSIDAIKYFGFVNNKVVFKNDVNGQGQELWITDGTVAGTMLLKDINVGTEASNPDHFYTFNNYCYFNAFTSQIGNELWRTDGTPDGTTLVKDANTSSNSDGPMNMFAFENNIYYNYGGELWISDGTETGTLLFKQIHPDFTSDPRDFMIYNNKMYFSAKRNGLAHELFYCDGTIEGTVPVLTNMNGYFAGSIREFNQRIWYSGTSDANGQELWRSDGTSTGTELFKDINTENNGVADCLDIENEMIEINGVLYFKGTDHSDVKELFQTNGSLNMTFKFTYDFSDNENGNPRFFSNLNNKLHFSADYLNAGGALYVLGDGTLDNKVLKDNNYYSIYPNPSDGILSIHSNSQLIRKVEIVDAIGNLVYSSMVNSNSFEVNLKNNLANGTYLVKVYDIENLSSISKISITNR